MNMEERLSQTFDRLRFMSHDIDKEWRNQALAMATWAVHHVLSEILADRARRDLVVALISAGITAVAVVIGAALF